MTPKKDSLFNMATASELTFYRSRPIAVAAFRYVKSDMVGLHRWLTKITRGEHLLEAGDGNDALLHTEHQVIHLSQGSWVLVNVEKPDRFSAMPHSVFVRRFEHLGTQADIESKIDAELDKEEPPQ